MHIAFLSIESPFEVTSGGIGSYLRAIIPALIARGQRVTLVAQARSTGFSCAWDGALQCFHFRLPALHWYLAKLLPCVAELSHPIRQLEWSLRFRWLAKKVLAAEGVDVVESTALGALFLRRAMAAPLIVRLHGSNAAFSRNMGKKPNLGSLWDHWLERAVWSRADAITAPSRCLAEDVGQEMGWAGERVRVIPNPIAPEMLARALMNSHRAECPHIGAPLVLYAGRLAAVKGIPILVEAARMVRQEIPRARFVLAGPWQMRQKPDEWMAGELVAAGGGLTWLGPLPPPRLAELYSQAAAFVMPSYYESFGIACIEAMAFGLPVVAAAVGGLKEVVEDGCTGLFFPPGDAAALAEAILSLLRHPRLRMRLGRAGRERVLNQYTADRVAQLSLEAYGQALAERQSEAPLQAGDAAQGWRSVA
jgi:glycogen(starch) synthase